MARAVLRNTETIVNPHRQRNRGTGWRGCHSRREGGIVILSLNKLEEPFFHAVERWP